MRNILISSEISHIADSSRNLDLFRTVISFSFYILFLGGGDFYIQFLV